MVGVYRLRYYYRNSMVTRGRSRCRSKIAVDRMAAATVVRVVEVDDVEFRVNLIILHVDMQVVIGG